MEREVPDSGIALIAAFIFGLFPLVLWTAVMLAGLVANWVVTGSLNLDPEVISLYFEVAGIAARLGLVVGIFAFLICYSEIKTHRGENR